MNKKLLLSLLCLSAISINSFAMLGQARQWLSKNFGSQTSQPSKSQTALSFASYLGSEQEFGSVSPEEALTQGAIAKKSPSISEEWLARLREEIDQSDRAWKERSERFDRLASEIGDHLNKIRDHLNKSDTGYMLPTPSEEDVSSNKHELERVPSLTMTPKNAPLTKGEPIAPVSVERSTQSWLSSAWKTISSWFSK